MTSLRDKLAAMHLSQFSFLSFEKEVSSPNEQGEKITYLIFQLENPIPKVTGSALIYNPDGDGAVNPTLEEVSEVRCNAELIYLDEEKPEDKREFHFESDQDGKLTGKGRYAGDLFLDISTRREQVWLTDVKFRTFGQNKRNDGQRERYQRYKK